MPVSDKIRSAIFFRAGKPLRNQFSDNNIFRHKAVSDDNRRENLHFVEKDKNAAFSRHLAVFF